MPTGTVTFFSNGTSLNSATVTNGVATLSTSTLATGANSIPATYTGNSTYACRFFYRLGSHSKRRICTGQATSLARVAQSHNHQPSRHSYCRNRNVNLRQAHGLRRFL